MWALMKLSVSKSRAVRSNGFPYVALTPARKRYSFEFGWRLLLYRILRCKGSPLTSRSSVSKSTQTTCQVPNVPTSTPWSINSQMMASCTPSDAESHTGFSFIVLRFVFVFSCQNEQLCSVLFGNHGSGGMNNYES